jgi:hypothetical protein
MSLKALMVEEQSYVLEHLLAFDVPKGAWRVQRPDGQYFMRWGREREWTSDASKAMPFMTQAGAQHLIDINHGSDAGRKAFRGCRPVLVEVEAGDHIVCACGQLHERDYCPNDMAI